MITNVIIERARFNKRSQIPGGIDTFVQGVLDDSLSDRLQSKATLTLSQAVHMSRQTEWRKQNRDLVRGGDTKSNQVDYVRLGKNKNNYPNNTEKPAQQRN